MELERPIYLVDVSTLQNTTTDTFASLLVNLTCNSSVQVLNYTLLWTTPLYPSSLILFNNGSNIISDRNIFGFELRDKFTVIGPDFELIVNAPPSISVIIIDSSTIVISQQAVGLVNVEVYNGGEFSVIFVTNNSIYSVNTRREVHALAIQPCGFNSIKQVIKSEDADYVVINSNNQECICLPDFTKCSLVTSDEAY